MPSRRLVNLISFRLLDGITEEGRKKVLGQLRDASNQRHPWLTSPGADPSRRRAGRKASGRAAAVRPDAPPSDWARKHGWKSEEDNLSSISQFLVGTGNAGVLTQIAKKQKAVKSDG